MNTGKIEYSGHILQLFGTIKFQMALDKISFFPSQNNHKISDCFIILYCLDGANIECGRRIFNGIFQVSCNDISE